MHRDVSPLRWGPLLAAALMATGGCRCSPLVAEESGFIVDPKVDFGTVPLGETGRRPLMLLNTGRAPLDLTLETDAPFGAEHTVLTLAGGGSASVELTFRPAVLGPAVGTLTVTGAGTERDVDLSGLGVDPCSPKDACHASVFDASLGQCTDEVLADGTACTQSCVKGTCQAGACLGAFDDCDDGDVCTVDSCSPADGCQHTARACPVSGACRVATCDRTLGCGDDAIADGTACGPATCGTAQVCIAGACVSRATPNGAADCSYTGVCAAHDYTCASTRSGRLRCWGSGFRLGSNADVVSPFFVPGALDVQAPICGETPSWLTRVGRLGPRDVFLEADAGARLTKVVATTQFPMFTGLDETGTVTSVWAGSARVVAAGVRDLFMGKYEPYLLFHDGGVRIGQRAHEFSAMPQTLIHADDLAEYDDVIALLPDGRVVEGSGSVRVDGGATAIGAANLLNTSFSSLCWAAGRSVRCGARPAVWPHEPLALTSRGGALCSLSDAGEVACWGDNYYGETSDRGTVPLGLTRFDDGGFQALGAGPVALRGSEVIDAVSTPRLDAGESSVRIRALAPGATAVSERCVLQGQTMACWNYATSSYQPVSTDIVSLCQYSRCGIDRSRRLVCMPGAEQQLVGDISPLSLCPTGVCALRTDGGVTCAAQDVRNGPVEHRRVALPGVPTVVTEEVGCGLVEGDVYCWFASPPTTPLVFITDGGFTGRKISGIRKPVRLLRGDYGSGCAVSGQNGLQCWNSGELFDLAVSAQIVELTVGAFANSWCVLLDDGEVYCWGDNRSGQLGFVPNRGHFPVPVIR